MEVKLYVGNMSFDTTEGDLRSMFAEAGEVTAVELIKDRETGRSKGFAFVTMANQADAAKATTMFHGKEVNGRPLTVNTAKPREERPGGFRGGHSNYGSKGGNNRGRSGGNNRW